MDEQGRTFIVMEKMEGEALAEKIAGKPLPMEEVLELGIQIADALAAAHAKGIVHRDLKPGNVFVTTDRQAKLLDFGLAKITHNVTPTAETDSFDSLTAAGRAVGTLPYMSPEQLRNDQVDAGTDIWAAGALLYEMTTGCRPFPQTGLMLVDAIMNGDIIRPTALNANVSDELESIIFTCLQKDREDRYASATDLGLDLRRLATSENFKPEINSRIPQEGSARRRPVTREGELRSRKRPPSSRKCAPSRRLSRLPCCRW